MSAQHSVMWAPIVVASGKDALAIRVATRADVPTLERWDADPSVIACTTDDPDASQAFAGAVWVDEIAGNSDFTCYYIAELDGRPIGAMQVIDPAQEPTQYWGDVEPNLRAIDIWIGDARDRNCGHGGAMMRAVIDRCFNDPAVTAIVIDPLNSNTDAHRFYQRLGFKVVGRRLFGEDDCLVHRLDRAGWRKGNEMPKVLISDELSQAAIDIFKNRGVEVDFKPGLKKPELIEIIGNYDGLAVRSATKADKDVIAAAKKLKVIGRAGIGVDNIDIPGATQRGIVVMNTPFGNSITTAEHAIALMFAAARQVPEANLSTQAGKWEKNRFMGRELFAKTLGLIGCGNIGSIVADRALGLKMKVIAFDPFLTQERAVQIGVEKVELEELLTRADIISLHTPLTEKTKNILSREALAKTKRGVIVINAARGGLVDEAALREALESGHVAAAGFDVFTVEPAKENPLFGAPNFIATPHLGASTNEAQENVALQVAEQMSDYLLTGAVSNALNMPSITAEEAPRLKPFALLAEKLGAFAGQLVDEGLDEVAIEYEGDVTRLNMKPLTAAALAGVLRPLLQDVNMVSAPALLKERGAPLTESTRDDSPTYDSLIRIKVKTGGGWRTLAGTLVGGQPRIVEVKNMALEAPFHPLALYTNNADKPGFIGALGTLLGDARINIATFHLGRDAAGGEAIALLGIDQPIPDAVMDKIRALPHVRYAKLLRF